MGALKKISVIIPAYNVEAHIATCLASLERQTHENLEVILINDGSADKTEEIIKAYMGKSRLEIRYFSQTNHGQAYTRNFGTKQASGEYIAYIDSDDYLDADYLARLYETAETYESDVVNSGYRVVKEDGTVLTEVNISPFLAVSDFGRAGVFVVWSKLFRTSFIREKQLSFPEGKLYEDVPFSIAAKFQGKNVKSISYIGYNYVQHENSTMSSAVKSSRFPYKELEAVLSETVSLEHVCKKELEFEVLHFFAGFLFLYCKKAGREDVISFCDYASGVMAKYFPDYKKNPYVGLFRSKELPFTYRAAIKAFVILNRMHLLKAFTLAITK